MSHRTAAFLVLSLGVSVLGAETKREQAQELMKQLAKDRDPEARALAAWTLGRMGATDAVPSLIAALEDEEWAVRANAGAALWNLKDVAAPAKPALQKALGDAHPRVVANAAGALRALGVPKQELLPVYRKLAAESDCAVRLDGLRELQGGDAWKDLFARTLPCCDDSEMDVRREAGDVLRSLLKIADPALPSVLVATLRSGYKGGGLGDVASALARQRPEVAEAIPLFVELLDSPDLGVRKTGIYSLRDMGPAAKDAVPRLVKRLDDSDMEVRRIVADAIGEIGSAASSAVARLIEVARGDKFPEVRRAAIDALGEIGPEAKAAIPVLNEALRDPDGFISMSAERALRVLDPDGTASKNLGASSPPAAAPPEVVSLFEDATGIARAFAGKATEAVELVIHDDVAFLTVPDAASATGYVQYTYRAGAVTGPRETHETCERKFRIADVNFGLIPQMVAKAPGVFGKPGTSVSHVAIGGGVFCKKTTATVFVEEGRHNVGDVVFTLDGKVKDVTKY